MTTGERALRNYLGFAFLLAILAGVHVILAANPGMTRSVAQAAVFQWWFLSIVAGTGLVGVTALTFTNLRGLWDADLSSTYKIVIPLIAGIALGVVYAVGDTWSGYGAIVAREHHLPSIHIAWPLSAPVYFGGAILVSILYFLVLLPPLHLLIARAALKGRAEPVVYWLLAAPLALIEPITQNDFTDVARLGQIALPNLIGDLADNFAQVWFFRRAGFIACIAMRVGFYAVWHVVYPNLPTLASTLGL